MPQHRAEAGAEQAHEALIDQFELRHAAAGDWNLALEIVTARRARGAALVSGGYLAAVHAAQQRVDFFLLENFRVSHYPLPVASPVQLPEK